MGSIQVLSIARLLWMGYLSHKMDLHNYQEWIAERQRLLERIKELEAENAELKKRLGEDVVPVAHEPTAMHKLSAQEKVELFRSVFKGREDVFARRWVVQQGEREGWLSACMPERMEVG